MLQTGISGDVVFCSTQRCITYPSSLQVIPCTWYQILVTSPHLWVLSLILSFHQCVLPFPACGVRGTALIAVVVDVVGEERHLNATQVVTKGAQFLHTQTVLGHLLTSTIRSTQYKLRTAMCNLMESNLPSYIEYQGLQFGTACSWQHNLEMRSYDLFPDRRPLWYSSQNLSAYFIHGGMDKSGHLWQGEERHKAWQQEVLPQNHWVTACIPNTHTHILNTQANYFTDSNFKSPNPSLSTQTQNIKSCLTKIYS